MARHWVFDLDGTLVDSHTVYFQTLHELLPRQGLSIESVDFEKVRKQFGLDFLKNYFEHSRAEEIFRELTKMNIERLHQVTPFDGISSVLSDLRSSGRTVSVWTGRDGESARATLKHHGLDAHLHYFASCTCVTNNKPHPEGLFKVMREAKSHADEVIMVGDTHFDIDAAKAAGVRSVSVSWNDDSSNQLRGHSDHHFATVAEFHDWVRTHLD